MFGGSLILGSDCVRVVPRHPNRRPPEPGLLLTFRDHGVESGGMKMSQRVEVHVLGYAGPYARSE